MAEHLVRMQFEGPEDPFERLHERADRLTLRLDEVADGYGQLAASMKAVVQRLAALEQRHPVVAPPPDPPAQPPRGFADQAHAMGLVASGDFDPAAPTLADGTPLTTRQRQLYSAFLAAFLNPNADTFTNAIARLGHTDSYAIGRGGQIVQVPAQLVFRRIRDLRILDHLTRGWNRAFLNLRTSWDMTRVRPGDSQVSSMGRFTWNGTAWVDTKPELGDPWSPYPKWLYSGNAGTAGQGTDVNNLQTAKPWAILMEYVWTLEQNRGAISPAGFDYGAIADAWRPAIVGFVRAWSDATTQTWARNYRGLDGGILYGSGRTRAAAGSWPILVRGEGHAAYNAVLMHHYLGLLVGTGRYPELAGGAAAAQLAATDLLRFMRGHLPDSIDDKGRPALVFGSFGDRRIMAATYTAYVFWEIQHIVDTGVWPDVFTPDSLVRLARSAVEMHNPDGSTKANIASGYDRAGHGWDVTGGSPRSQHQNAINGFCAPLMWEEGDYLWKAGTASQEARGGGYGASARAHPIIAAQLIRAIRDGV
jgi:hypothetical protein